VATHLPAPPPQVEDRSIVTLGTCRGLVLGVDANDKCCMQAPATAEAVGCR
jgi:hypothetical protein